MSDQRADSHGRMLTLEAFVSEATEKEKAPAEMPGGGGMGGMY